MNLYEGTLPVDQEWAEAHQGEDWAIQFTADFYDLLDLNSMEGINELADDICGVVLTNSGYRLVELLNDRTLLIEVSGTVEEF
jgi:hypothetical protein